VFALALALAGCPKPAARKLPPLNDFNSSVGGDPVAAALAELQDDILESYDRDDPPDVRSGMINPPIGGTRIGVGPGDVEAIDNPARGSTRWPLDVVRDTVTTVRSKRLEIHAARDLSAAWMVDELSWRIEKCGRIAVLPLRITALYAHDGDRWIQVFEHLSFARIPEPAADTAQWVRIHPVRKELRVPQTFNDDLSAALASVVRAKTGRAPQIASEAVLLGPDVADEWRGDAIARAQLPKGLRAEDRQIGTVGRTIERATVAYWIGNFTVDVTARPGIPAGRVLLRGTFVFEKRDTASGAKCGDDASKCQWFVVLGHLHEPIDDDSLALRVFGTALLSAKPLEIDCGDLAGPTLAPAAAP
jgi:hypothetical protein